MLEFGTVAAGPLQACLRRRDSRTDDSAGRIEVANETAGVVLLSGIGGAVTNRCKIPG